MCQMGMGRFWESEKTRRPPWLLALATRSWIVSVAGREQAGGAWWWYRFGDGYQESSFVCIKFEIFVRDIQVRDVKQIV